MQRWESGRSASYTPPHTLSRGRVSGVHSTTPAVTEPDVELTESRRLDDHGGKYPSVCLDNGGTAVAVHNSSMGNSMWYWVGRVDGVEKEIHWANGRHFDYGLYPSVALKDSGLVLEVHRSQWQHELKYRIGKVEGDFIKWRESRKYANGTDPSVSINGSDRVVAVHVSSERNRAHINCIVGRSSSKSIRWGSCNKLREGALPHVAINENDTVVLAYQSESHCIVQCQVGIANDTSVHWGKSIDYGKGLCASVSLTSYNRLLLLRQGLRLDELLYGVAQVDPHAKEIEEEGDVEQCRHRKLTQHKIHRGGGNGKSKFFWHPSISINDQGIVLAVYASNDAYGRALWYCIGSLSESDNSGEATPPSYHGSDEEQYLSSPSDEC